jgi:hypothetical protein
VPHDDRESMRNLATSRTRGLDRRDHDGSATGILAGRGPVRRNSVVEGKAELSPVAADPYDAVVEDLVDYYRTASGEHPDWDEYRSVMVADKRLMFSMTVDHAYGMPKP